MTLFTIGFTKTTAEHFFTRLNGAGVKRIIDGKEPEILDIVRMERDETAETHGFQMENRNII